MRRGSNLPAVGSYNQALVLDLIRRAPEGLSRVELAARTGLSPQTLSNVTRRLVAEGLVSEAGKVIAGPGKPRTMLALDPQARFAVGVHLDPAVETVVVVDLAGTVVARAEHPPRRAGAADVLVATVADAVDELLVAAEVPRERVLGIGVAAPGPFDADAGRLFEPPLLPAWHGVAVRDALESATGLETIVEKDVIAAMIGEMWVAVDDELSDAMFLYYGAGVGMGLASAGSPVRGRTGNAGDVGHLVVDTDGPRCPRCGGVGCLGVGVEPQTLLAAAGVDSPGESPGELRDALDEVVRRADAGDERVRAALAVTATRLATGIVQTNNLLDVDRVVAGGLVWDRLARVLRPLLVESLGRSTASTATRSIALRETRLGTDVAAAGAACLVLDRAFTARPSNLLITV